MALGADRIRVLLLVAKDAFQLVGVGLILGLPLTLFLGRLWTSRLYGMSSFNVQIIFGAALALAFTAAMAILLPALRAAWMVPMAALRRE
jgi:putative ABC transport system permease protein